jgi:hypothetical protein
LILLHTIHLAESCLFGSFTRLVSAHRFALAPKPFSVSLLAELFNIRMIRRGKTERWLQLPQDAFLPWARINEVTFDRTVPGSIPDRGGALLAKDDLNADEDMSNVLLTVPMDLILSLERVQEHAKVDKDFREVIESLGDFGRVGLTW